VEQDHEPELGEGRPDLGSASRNELRDRLLKAGAFQIAEAYEGAVRIITTPDMPARRHLLAHLVRDIGEGLPEVLTGKSKELRRSNTTPLLADLVVEWREAVPRPARLVADAGELPPPTLPVPTVLVGKVHDLLTEHERGKLNRHDKHVRLMEALRPGTEALRPVMEPVIVAFLDVIDRFTATTHLPRPSNTAGKRRRSRGKKRQERRHIRTEADLQRLFESFEYGLRGLLDGHFDVVREIDAVVDGPGTIEEKLVRVKSLLAGPEQLRYFFQHLDDPAWLPALTVTKLMHPPPPVRDDARNTVAHWSWPAAPYLIKMAAEPAAQEAVAEFVAGIKTQNYRAQNDLAAIALLLPTSLAARVAGPLAHTLEESQDGMPLPAKLFALTEKLAGAGEKETTKALLRALVSVIPDHGGDREFSSPEPQTRVRHHQLVRLAELHLRGIVAALGLDALGILCDALAEAVRLSSRDERVEDAKDYSHLWHPAIEAPSKRDARGALATLVRQAAEGLIDNDPALLAEALTRIERRRLVFRRIALHLLLRLPEPPPDLVAARALDRVLFEHIRTCREYRMLLDRGFGLLSVEQQAQWLAWIDAPPTARLSSEAATDDAVLKRQRHWQWERLALVARALTGDWQARFEGLVQEFGLPESPDRLDGIQVGSVAPGEGSPLSVEQIREMSAAKLAAYCKGHRLVSSGPFDSREALGHTIKLVVAEAPERFAEAALEFRETAATYVNGLLGGLEDAVRARRPFMWAEVLGLSRWVVRQPVEAADPPQQWADVRWGWTRATLLRLLDEAFRQSPSPLPKTLRPDVWALLSELCSDPDAERRAQALEAVVTYALWLRTDSGQIAWGLGLDDLPEVRQTLGEALDRRPHASAVHRALGHQVPVLVFLDEAWLRSRLHDVFPTSLEHAESWRAAWRGYLNASGQLYERAFVVMRDVYAEAVRRLTPEPSGSRYHDGNQLADHLAVLHGVGWLQAHSAENVLEHFFASADIKLRRHLLFAVPQEMHAADSVGDETIARFRQLWSERRAAGDAEELRTFGDWFACGPFDEAWRLEELESVLRMVGTIEHDGLVVETLAEAAARRPAEAMRCFRLLVEKLPDAGSVYGWLDPAKTILGAGLRSDDTAVRDDALAAFHRLGSLGFRAREIVPVSDDLDDPAAIAYFTWDHPMTVAEIRRRLTEGSEPERHRMLGQILREAKGEDVWKFTTPEEVRDLWPHVEKHLGRRREMWELLFKQWKEQGLLAG
jgi:hypothetical protein